MWLNFISRISSLIHKIKTKFIYAGVWKTIGLSAIVILLELFLLIASLPVYIFIAPEKISKDKKEVEKYKLKRKFSLIGVAGFLLLVILKITLFSGLLFSGSSQIRALSLSWDFNNSADYIYNSNMLKLSNGMAVFNYKETDQTINKLLIPAIQPIHSLKAPNIIRWTNFTEIADKNNGDIYYQLSNDEGKTWHYWNGINWSEAGENDYNEAAIIDSEISGFQPVNEQIKFKAFFSNNNSAEIKLFGLSLNYDSISAKNHGIIPGYSENNLWLYYDFGNGYWIFGIREASSVTAIDSKGQCIKFEGKVRKCSQGDYAFLSSIKALLQK